MLIPKIILGLTFVIGVTECPLAPGESKVYSFKATQYGTSWYHSHYRYFVSLLSWLVLSHPSAQYGDGVWGAIVINGPASAEV